MELALSEGPSVLRLCGVHRSEVLVTPDDTLWCPAGHAPTVEWRSNNGRIGQRPGWLVWSVPSRAVLATVLVSEDEPVIWDSVVEAEVERRDTVRQTLNVMLAMGAGPLPEARAYAQTRSRRMSILKAGWSSIWKWKANEGRWVDGNYGNPDQYLGTSKPGFILRPRWR